MQTYTSFAKRQGWKINDGPIPYNNYMVLLNALQMAVSNNSVSKKNATAVVNQIKAAQSEDWNKSLLGDIKQYELALTSATSECTSNEFSSVPKTRSSTELSQTNRNSVKPLKDAFGVAHFIKFAKARKWEEDGLFPISLERYIKYVKNGFKKWKTNRYLQRYTSDLSEYHAANGWDFSAVLTHPTISDAMKELNGNLEEKMSKGSHFANASTEKEGKRPRNKFRIILQGSIRLCSNFASLRKYNI